MRTISKALMLGIVAAFGVAVAFGAEAKRAKPAKAPAAQAAAGCDRACLIGFADRYMDAMVAHQASSLPWAKVVRFSENSVPMEIGDGLWGSITAHSAAPLYAADPSTGEVAWFGAVEEHGQPSFFALSLKVTDGKIAEAQTVVRRKGGPPRYGDPEATTHDPAFGETPPPEQRQSRERLIALVEGYFNTVQGNDGVLFTPFDPECARMDNGVVTTSGDTAEGGVQGCEAQFKAGVFNYVERLRERRFPIVDEQRGVVVASGFYDLPNSAESFVGADGKARPAPAKYPYSIGFLTAFKIRDGRIYRIESIAGALPYLMPAP